MALKTPYATVAEADAYFDENDSWLDLEEVDKENHLLNGRYYIDGKYSCTDLVDGDPIPEEYTYANALLALEDSVTPIFSVSTSGDNSLVKTKVVAGPVSTEKVYSGYTGDSKKEIDRYPQITALLSEYCSFKSSTGMTTTFIYRG